MSNVDVAGNLKFAPYQTDFIRRFTAEVGPGSRHLLVAPVGAGKTHALVWAISELMRSRRLGRTLVLTSARVLASQWAYAFLQRDQETVDLDGRALRLLRERIADTPGMWPEGVYTMTVELAKRSDVRDLITAVAWNLITIDEARLVTDEQSRLFDSFLHAVPPPAVLLTTHDIGAAGTFASQASVIDWSSVGSWFNLAAPLAASCIRSTRTYSRSSEEIEAIEFLVHAARQLDQPRAKVLLQRASSSIASLESTLVRWLEVSADRIEREPDPQTDTFLQERERSDLEHLLDVIDDLHKDSKLDCLKELIRELEDQGIRHIVVFSNDRSTTDYIAAALESRVHCLYDDWPMDERSDSTLASFTNDGGVLVTEAAQGVSLGFVEAAVHYDLPLSIAIFAEREGRYWRYGRKQPCAVYFLKDVTSALRIEELLHTAIQNADLVHSLADIDVDEMVRASLQAAPVGI